MYFSVHTFRPLPFLLTPLSLGPPAPPITTGTLRLQPGLVCMFQSSSSTGIRRIMQMQAWSRSHPTQLLVLRLFFPFYLAKTQVLMKIEPGQQVNSHSFSLFWGHESPRTSPGFRECVQLRTFGPILLQESRAWLLASHPEPSKPIASALLMALSFCFTFCLRMIILFWGSDMFCC